jgi:hypothetical protein
MDIYKPHYLYVATAATLKIQAFWRKYREIKMLDDLLKSLDLGDTGTVSQYVYSHATQIRCATIIQQKFRNILERKKIKEFCDSLKVVIPKVKTRWDSETKPYLEACPYFNLVDFLKKSPTAERTKMFSNFFYQIMFQTLREIHGDNFEEKEINKQDIEFKGIPIEIKLTLSTDNSWTGNGFEKVPWHLLIKLKMDDNINITDVVVLMVNLKLCTHQWSAPGTTSNFSSLKFIVNDEDKLQMVFGSPIKKKKYLGFQFEKVNIITHLGQQLLSLDSN